MILNILGKLSYEFSMQASTRLTNILNDKQLSMKSYQGKNINAYILYLATKTAVFNMFFIKM